MGRPPGSTWVFQNCEKGGEGRGLVICLAEGREGGGGGNTFFLLL